MFITVPGVGDTQARKPRSREIVNVKTAMIRKK
jgi:hypothetical protein